MGFLLNIAVISVVILSFVSIIFIEIFLLLGINFTEETDVFFLTASVVCFLLILLVSIFIFFLRLVGVSNFIYRFVVIPFNYFSESYFKAANKYFFYYSWLQKYPKAWRIFIVFVYNLLILGLLVIIMCILPYKCLIYLFYYLYYLYSLLLLGRVDMVIVNIVFF